MENKIRQFLILIGGKSSNTIICASGSKFAINNKEHAVAEFNECTHAITGNVLNRNRQCANDGIFMNIGFQLSDGRGFVNLIDVCYSKRRGSAIYTSHVVPGKTIKNSMKTSSRPSTFKTTEIPTKVSAAASFTKAKQLERFTSILGSSVAEEYLNKTFLARGHLTPDGDMVMSAWQWSTYYYINVIPQFQSINNGNWKHIESAVRTKAAQFSRDLTVFTGAFDVLKLKNKKITLDSDGLEVPKWSWKVVKDETSNSAMAFVTLNNPFASSITNICNDLCDEHGWDWKDRKVFVKGYTICCAIDELQNVIDFIPSEAFARNVLQK